MNPQQKAPTVAATVVTLWGLRWSELAGRHGVVLGAAIAAWIAVSTFGASMAIGYLGAPTAVSMVSGLFVVWSLAPLIGAGSTEVASTERLVAFPVDPRALKWANWVASSLDVPVMLGVGLVLGAGYAVAGAAGVLAGVAVIAAGTGIGQVTAALSGQLVARWGWRGAAMSAAGVIAGLTTIAATGSLPALLGVMPGAWLDGLGQSLAANNSAGAAGWAGAFVGLLAAVVTALRHTRHTSPAIEDAQRDFRPWLRVPVTMAGALRFAVWSSVLRSPTTRLLLLGSQVAPFFIIVSAAFATDNGRIDIVGSAVALGVLATIGVNMFSYLGGGASLIAGDSMSARQCLRAFGVLLVALVVISGVVATITTSLLGIAEITARGTIVALSVAVGGTGLGMWWSVRRPAVCDHGSLRSRPAPLRSSSVFALSITFTILAFDALTMVSLAAPVVAAVVMAGGLWLRAERRLARCGPGEVVTAVRG